MPKVKGISPSKTVETEIVSDDDEDENNMTYEQLREKRMRENLDLFEWDIKKSIIFTFFSAFNELGT